MSNYKFYMARLIGDAWEDEVSLEDYFQGMKYISCEGLSNYGKIKNIYTESFAEVEDLRVYMPETVVRENTDIEFVFGFEKENRRGTFDSFVDWVGGHVVKYRDTARNREVEMVLIEKIEVDDDLLIGSSPFITVPFKFKNLRGRTKKHNTEIA